MKAKIFYRIAAVLLLLFAVGHTAGFRQTDPSWGVDATVAAMKSIHFDAQGFNRTYWDFFSGLGLVDSVFLVFAAVLAWQLGSLPPETLRGLRAVTWAFAACFAAVTVVTWMYIAPIPLVFAAVTDLFLIAGAVAAGRGDANPTSN